MTIPPADVELAALVVRAFIADADAELRLPTTGEQLAIDVVAAWTYPPRAPAEVIPFSKPTA